MSVADMPVNSSSAAVKIDRNGLHIRADALYGDTKGKENRKIRENSEHMLDVLDEVLKKVLEPGETIFFIGRAQGMPGALEQLALGWHTYSLPRVALVLTDRRIVVLRVRGKFGLSWQWDRGIRSIRWADLSCVSRKGWVTKYVRLTLRRGETISFWRINRSDAKRIKSIADLLSREASGQASPSGAADSLCPSCLSILTPAQYQCVNCQLAFKNESSLIHRGILIPGGASFYVGQTGLGLLRAFAEVAMLLFVISEITLALLSPRGSAVASAAWTAAAFFLFMLLLDKLIAILVCRRQIRDFLPQK